jgi:hypothetical protein
MVSPRNTGYSPIPTGSPAPRTASPYASTGLTAKVVAGLDGSYFLVEQATGMRMT